MKRSSPVVDPASRDKYLLHVTAGPTRDPSTHTTVDVNGPSYQIIENDLMSCYLKIRIKDYHGLPRNSPPTCDYFQHPTHLSDRYSVAFSFVPKTDLAGADIVTGFDFDHSIKDRLPPGFKYAMKIVTTLLDPGIFSDPYSDNPYLYGPGLSSFFSFRIGEHTATETADSQMATLDADFASVILEGADGSGQRIRADAHIPSKTSKRRKHFLTPANLGSFVFEKGRLYHADFFNPYLDFANFGLSLPGFSISVARYIDDKTHQLRFVMKNRRTEEVLLCVIFELLFGRKLDRTLEGEREGGERLGNEEGDDSARDRGRRISSEDDTPAASTRSSSATSMGSQIGDDGRQSRQTAAGALASSIYSSFAALGFGRTASSSESSPGSSLETSPERALKKDETANGVDTGIRSELDGEPSERLDEKVDKMGEEQVEQFLKSRNGSA